jgi:hypothetical protein
MQRDFNSLKMRFAAFDRDMFLQRRNGACTRRAHGRRWRVREARLGSAPRMVYKSARRTKGYNPTVSGG